MYTYTCVVIYVANKSLHFAYACNMVMVRKKWTENESGCIPVGVCPIGKWLRLHPLRIVTTTRLIRSPKILQKTSSCSSSCMSNTHPPTPSKWYKTFKKGHKMVNVRLAFVGPNGYEHKNVIHSLVLGN